MSHSTVGFSPSTVPNLEDAEKVGSLDPRLSRTDYFDGRLLTATDLIRDQTYVDERVLEVGRALGSGVVRGLGVELSEDKRFLRVNPGLAISESGRILEVTTDKPLEIDLYDRALMINLNQGRYRRFNRGLYAVTLQYVEMGSDSAESYPADPTEKNEFQYDSFVEGAEVTLTPLNYPLPSDNELVSRATLAQHFLPNPGQINEISDQAISLGLLAFNNDRPQWIDLHLLRRPMRPEHLPASWQMDLHRHYLELLDTVMLERNSQSQYGEFLAAQYFHLLPPAGVLPIACVDPIKAAQYFFPENYEISISPVRYEDLAVIQSESMQLAPLDLIKGEAAEIMILAPMSNQDFMDHARSLGYKPEADHVLENKANYWLHATDLLQQRLSVNSVIASDNAQTVWRNIWRTLGDGLLHYVRRPARAAETQVSAVVLAHGFEIPDPDNNTDDLIDEQRERIAQLEEANGILSNEKITLNEQNRLAGIALESVKTKRDEFRKQLKECRDSQSSNTGHDALSCLRDKNCIDNLLRNRGMREANDIAKASDFLTKTVNEKPEDAKLIWDTLSIILPVNEKLLWSTLETVQNKGNMANFHEIIMANPTDTVKAIVEKSDGLGLTAKQKKSWKEVLDGVDTGTVDRSGIRDIKQVLDMRGTTNLETRASAETALKQLKKKEADMQSAETIVKHVNGGFDEVLWKTMASASEKGSLKDLERLTVLHADNPKELASEVVANAREFGIDPDTASQWEKLGSKLS